MGPPDQTSSFHVLMKCSFCSGGREQDHCPVRGYGVSLEGVDIAVLSHLGARVTGRQDLGGGERNTVLWEGWALRDGVAGSRPHLVGEADQKSGRRPQWKSSMHLDSR